MSRFRARAKEGTVPAILETLESVGEKAREGDAFAVAVVLVGPRGVVTAWNFPEDMPRRLQTVGAVEVLKAELVAPYPVDHGTEEP